MAIIDPEIERLATELAELTGESQTEAVLRSLEERRQRLAPPSAPPDRVAGLRLFLEKDVWPYLPPGVRGKRITREEREEILGYGPDGV